MRSFTIISVYTCYIHTLWSSIKSISNSANQNVATMSRCKASVLLLIDIIIIVIIIIDKLRCKQHLTELYSSRFCVTHIHQTLIHVKYTFESDLEYNR